MNRLPLQRPRGDDLERFHDLLDRLMSRQPARRLADVTGSDDWPERGVYFFMEDGELRGNGRPRIVRVGTHALKAGASSTLWTRLRQHRGTRAPKGGNHRTSVFRDLVGGALMARGFPQVPSWGRRPVPAVIDQVAEDALEAAVSDHIGAMRVAWLDIDDAPGPESLRAVIERNAIALLSNFTAPEVDPPGPHWLGHYSDSERVRLSGLWNRHHVAERHDSRFLDILEKLVSRQARLPAKVTPTPATEVSPIYVMQCAKAKRADGWWRDASGCPVHFVADPDDAPAQAGMHLARPDDPDEEGRSWRSRLLDYNATYTRSGENPLGLHEAVDLYRAPAYGRLRHAVPPERLYILSAAWGLVRSDFLLPNYDISFSHGPAVPKHCRRAAEDDWRDFNMLDQMAVAPLIFIGGKRYLPAFARASRFYQGPRIAYSRSATPPEIPGVEIRRFETDTRTNWHYDLVQALLSDGGPPAGARAARDRPRPLSAPGPRTRDHGKYAPLFAFLTSLPAHRKTVTLTFRQIEDLLGACLPASSRKLVAVWWANGGHAQAAAWLDAGFVKLRHRVTKDDEESWVTFERGSPSRSR